MNLTEPQQARLVGEVERLERENKRLREAGNALAAVVDRVIEGFPTDADDLRQAEDALATWHTATGGTSDG